MQTQAVTAGVYTYTNSTSVVSDLASAMQVITSCNSTQQELMQEFTQQSEGQTSNNEDTRAIQTSKAIFEYVDHVRTYPKFKFGGVEGTRVCTIAFRKPM